jgi:hypothetical protein
VEEPKLQLTTRELTEIKHALFYNAFCNHGTVGHNMLVIIAKMAIDRGFACEFVGDDVRLIVPDNVAEVGA